MQQQKTEDNIIVYGTEWCPDCHRSRQLLDSQDIAYDYRDIDKNEAAKLEMMKLTNNRNVIPTIVINGEQILQEPSNDQLLTSLGLKESYLEKQSNEDLRAIHDVVIIGAGPAALSAAIYTTREDIETVLLERGVIGGLAAVTDKIDNYPGFPNGIEGLTLSANMQQQAERFGAVIELGEVLSIHNEGQYKRLETTNGDLKARVVLIATGSDYKKTGIPGEKEYYARGVHYCATCDGAFYRNKNIAVIGGGNSAIQESIFLTRFTSHIDLIVRSTIKASEVLQHDLQKYVDQGKITVHMNTSPTEIIGQNNQVIRLAVKDSNQKENQLAIDGVFIFVGLSPNSQFLEGSIIKRDELGFIITDEHLQTNMPGVFVAGDIRSGATMQIASACGEGATAALKIREYLEGLPHPVQN